MLMRSTGGGAELAAVAEALRRPAFRIEDLRAA
jgi:hypothetical protein